MAWLPEPDPKSVPEVTATFERVQKSRGWVSNLMRSLAHAPEGLQHYAALGHYCRYGTQLTEIQRELVICIIGRHIHYAATHHGGLALQIGITPSQLDSIKQDRTPQDLPEADRALCDYVFALASFKGMPEATRVAIQKHFTGRQITDISLIASYYLAAGSMIVAHDVQVEPPEVLQIELDWQKHTMATRKPGT